MLAVWQEVSAELEAARDQITQLSHQVTQLKIELDYERSRVASSLDDTEESQTISQRIIALNEEHQHLIDERDRLAARLREAETALLGAVSTDNEAMFKSMIEVLRREKEELLGAARPPASAACRNARAARRCRRSCRTCSTGMSQEKARLELERDELSSKLTDIEMQLRALGIEEGAAGITQLIGQLYEQRASLQTQERSAPARARRPADRAHAVRGRHRARERARQAAANAARSRSSIWRPTAKPITKQRDKLRADRDELMARQEALREQQARLLAEIAGYEQELTELREDEKAAARANSAA